MNPYQHATWVEVKTDAGEVVGQYCADTDTMQWGVQDKPSERRTCGLCRDCRWWDKPTEDCEQGFGYCRLFHSEHGIRETDTRAYAQDAESYEADLRCLAHFGCVQWEPKD